VNPTSRGPAGGALLLTAAQPGQLGRFRRRLSAWFHGNKRALPWRETRDPYRIWISEVMLQQTRVAAVLSYYRRFLKRFPNVRALARAPERDVLQAWAGLGYYSRARNLQRAAREIVRHHGGRFPRSFEAALALPGVGRYTAAAVLSIAYEAPLAVLDGNVARVLARLAALRGELRKLARWKQLETAAQQLLAERARGDWNQAMMELGATVCTPQVPACGQCPVAKFCRARALNLQEQIPATRKKRSPEVVQLAAAVLLDTRGRTLLVRPEASSDDGLFSRMWQFPAVRLVRRDRAETALRRHLRQQLGIEISRCLGLPAVRHTVTYRRVSVLPFLVPTESLPETAADNTRMRDAGYESEQRSRLPLTEVECWPTSSATRKIARRALAAASK
jgi:A/G-specific adenine glycosylase